MGISPANGYSNDTKLPITVGDATEFIFCKAHFFTFGYSGHIINKFHNSFMQTETFSRFYRTFYGKRVERKEKTFFLLTSTTPFSAYHLVLVGASIGFRNNFDPYPVVNYIYPCRIDCPGSSTLNFHSD